MSRYPLGPHCDAASMSPVEMIDRKMTLASRGLPRQESEIVTSTEGGVTLSALPESNHDALSGPSAPGVRHAEPVLGTVVSFEVRDMPPDGIMRAAIGWLHWVDETFSTYRPDSPLSRYARGQDRLDDCPRDVADVLLLCEQISQETEGYFRAEINGRLDVAGIVKGWAVTAASELLTAAGCPRNLVNGGGDLMAAAPPAPGQTWRVGIADPQRRGGLLTVVPLESGAVATSGAGEQGPHVLNPFTGRPARDLLSVTVAGPDLVRADGYATAAVAMGADAPDWLRTLDGYCSMVVDAAGRMWTSPSWPHWSAPLALVSS
jgi:thiamine biosynthesis lipoprotein